MGLVNFGQPDDGVIQMAYVVEDIHQAIDAWVKKLNVGPWFLLDSFTGVDPQYRGKPSEAAVSLAMSFAGHMMVELIQEQSKPRRSIARSLKDEAMGSITGASRPKISMAAWRNTKPPDMRWHFSPVCRPEGASAIWIRRAICLAWSN
jgi:hypothetical protein